MEPTGVTRAKSTGFPQDPSGKSRIRTPSDVFCMLYRYPNGTSRHTKVFHTNCRLLQLNFILKFIQYSYSMAWLAALRPHAFISIFIGKVRDVGFFLFTKLCYIPTRHFTNPTSLLATSNHAMRSYTPYYKTLKASPFVPKCIFGDYLCCL